MYDSLRFVDGSKPCPPTTITLPVATSPSPNPYYTLWLRQDQLLLNAIIGFVPPTLVQFLSTSTTSWAAWTTFEKTYASSPSCGRIHRQNLASPQQGTQTITEYMQDVKHNIDSLGLMNVPVDFDELYVHILNRLGPTYSNLSHALHSRDSSYVRGIVRAPPKLQGLTPTFGSSGSAHLHSDDCHGYFAWFLVPSSIEQPW